MKAELISVGTELLMGQIVDTNSQWLSQQLSAMGIDVYYKETVGDNPQRMRDTIAQALTRSDIIITTGGLGPTEDDITKETVSELMGEELVLHEESLRAIIENFARRSRPMAESNKKQAYMPKGGIVLPNYRGTAPGCILEKDGKRAIVLPGPPTEMKHMFTTSVVPYLESISDSVLKSAYVRISGIGESTVAEMLGELIHNQTNPTLATYASISDVTVRITAKCKKVEDADAILTPMVEKVLAILGDSVYSTCGESLPEVIAKLLTERKETLALAESCTGGMVSSMLIDIPGSSAFLMEGLVTYSNQAKSRLLDIPIDMIELHGAVSEEVARAMAEGVRKNAGTDYGLSITGIAGPDGGTEEKPVGLVYIGCADKNGTEVLKLSSGRSNRSSNRISAALQALNLLRKKILLNG
ncbi:MAG: competence/damage-inducible protein A [Clostridiales bacterium]|nr:competence/damage-inducible protein A [Clostridiales bacterium]